MDLSGDAGHGALDFRRRLRICRRQSRLHFVRGPCNQLLEDVARAVLARPDIEREHDVVFAAMHQAPETGLGKARPGVPGD